MVLSVDENSIVPVLNEVVANHLNVTIGSYPYVSQPDYQTILTIEGRLVPARMTNLDDDIDDVDDLIRPPPHLPQRQQRGDESLVSGRGQRSNSNIFSCARIDMSSRSQMDRYVESALDELIRRLPEGSILRVENNEQGVFD